MNIGEKIKKRRIQLNLSQEKLAEMLAYKSKSSISKIEKGMANVPASKLESIAHILNTTPEGLLSDSDTIKRNDNRLITLNDSSLTDISLFKNVSTHEKQKVIAVILAGGDSSRNHKNTPNQFLNVHGKPIVLYSIEAYERHPAIDEIYIVCLSGWESIVDAYVKTFNITKLKGIIPGGKTGALSAKNAIEWLSNRVHYRDIVIFQESTRPMVTEENISNAIRCVEAHGSAITYESMSEYLQFIQQETGITYLDRNNIISTQSPEAYRFGKIHQAYLDAIRIHHDFSETCFAMVMYHLNKNITFCEGNRYNIKIVREEDIKIFEALLKSNT